MTTRDLDLAGSSWVGSASYDYESNDLHVELSGASYTYHGVSEDVAKGLEDAGSPGSFVNSVLKSYGYSRG